MFMETGDSGIMISCMTLRRTSGGKILVLTVNMSCDVPATDRVAG
jgi:hypothetical protein